jgi:hypothetical protein
MAVAVIVDVQWVGERNQLTNRPCWVFSSCFRAFFAEVRSNTITPKDPAARLDWSMIAQSFWPFWVLGVFGVDHFLMGRTKKIRHQDTTDDSKA